MSYDVIMVRTQISLDRELYEDARREAARRGISFAELVRRALSHVVPAERDAQPWMELAGALEGAPDSSQTVDSVVYGRERP